MDYRFYDSFSRLIEADYNNGSSVLNYGYDVAGNMVDFDGTIRTFNVANQMTNDGTNTLTYDNNGNLTGNGSDTYTWDRANRLRSVGNHSYVYDGLGNRVQQTVSSVVTDYLNDLQPGLTKLLKQDDGTNVDRFVHAPRGIHAVDDGTNWNYYAQDGLGSVRALMDDAGVVQQRMSYDPYGMPLGTTPDNFGFTGEQTDASGSVFLRARYYEPTLGIFSALDPLEMPNRYAYVSGNPINLIDPTGLFAVNLDMSGTSAIIQQMTQAIQNVLTLSSNPLLIRNINSDWCSDNASKAGSSYGKRGSGSRILYSDPNQDSSEPCPDSSHPLVTGNPLADTWLNQLTFCIGGNKNQNIGNIKDTLQLVYGLNFPQSETDWTWDNLAVVGRGIWIIARAIEEYAINNPSYPSDPTTGEEWVRIAFNGTKIRTGPGSLQSYITMAPIWGNTSAAGVVPPVGLGGDGRTVYMRSGMYSRTFIHEMGHVLDFRLGARWFSYPYDFIEDDLDNSDIPSTMLYHATGSTYHQCAGTWCRETDVFPPLQILLSGALRLQDWYRPYPLGDATDYGTQNHYEDFADTWRDWILVKANSYHNLPLSGVGSYRLGVMDGSILNFLRSARNP